MEPSNGNIVSVLSFEIYLTDNIIGFKSVVDGKKMVNFVPNTKMSYAVIQDVKEMLISCQVLHQGNQFFLQMECRKTFRYKHCFCFFFSEKVSEAYLEALFAIYESGFSSEVRN